MQFSTPNIPNWIKGIRNPHYKNIFDYKLGNKHLWGTETLLGDWSGKYLVFAEDFIQAPTLSKILRPGCRTHIVTRMAYPPIQT